MKYLQRQLQEKKTMCIFTVIVQHSVTSRMSNLATGGYVRTKTKLKKTQLCMGQKVWRNAEFMFWEQEKSLTLQQP